MHEKEAWSLPVVIYTRLDTLDNNIAFSKLFIGRRANIEITPMRRIRRETETRYQNLHGGDEGRGHKFSQMCSKGKRNDCGKRDGQQFIPALWRHYLRKLDTHFFS